MPSDRTSAPGPAAVRAAFAGVRAPEPPLVDCPCPECEELERLLVGKAWTDLDGALAERLETELPLLSGRAFRAYLPAFLLAGYAEQVGEFLHYALEPGEFNTPRFEGLSDPQGRAVLDYLRWVVAECEAEGDEIYVEEPRRAIAEYWGRFG